MALGGLRVKAFTSGVAVRSGYINTAVLVAATAQQLTIPALAKYAQFKSEVPFYCLFGADPTAAIAAVSVTDGSGSDFCPEGIIPTDGAAKVSLISRMAGNVTVCYFDEA